MKYNRVHFIVLMGTFSVLCSCGPSLGSGEPEDQSEDPNAQNMEEDSEALSRSSSVRVRSLTLIDADIDQPISGFDPIEPGACLSFSKLGTSRLSIRANTSPSTVGSVRFELDANTNFRTENIVPYALAGNNGKDYLPWTPSIGQHTIKATPYTGSNATGTAGATFTRVFTVVDSSQCSGTAKLVWGPSKVDASHGAPDEYRIYRCSAVGTAENCTNFVRVGQVEASVCTPSSSQCTYTSSGLASGNTYCFQLKAYNSDGESGPANCSVGKCCKTIP